MKIMLGGPPGVSSSRYSAKRLHARSAAARVDIEVAVSAIRTPSPEGEAINFWFEEPDGKRIGFQVTNDDMRAIFADLFPEGK